MGRAVKHVAEADFASHLFGNSERGGAGAMAQMRADQNVVAHRQPGERLHDLEGARDAAPRKPVRRLAGDVVAAIADAAGAGLEEPGDDGEQRGFAGAIRTDQSGDAGGRRRQRCGIDGQQPTKAARHALDGKQRLSHGPPPAPAIAAARSAAPSARAHR